MIDLDRRLANYQFNRFKRLEMAQSFRRERTKAKRYLLDSNVWRYVVDSGEENTLIKFAKSENLLIQITPATVNEALRLGDRRLMNKIVRLQTKPCFDRLWAEVLVNSLDVINEIKRLHPEWIRSKQDHLSFKKWVNFWDKNWWARVRKSPISEAKHLNQIEGKLLENVREQAEANRSEMRRSPWSHNNLPMNTWQAEVPKPYPGWDKKTLVDFWRIKSLISVTNTILSSKNGMYPILDTAIDFSTGLVTSKQWEMFWLYEILEENMPRFWLDWSHGFASAFRKTTPGTPGDTQLFNYLPDTDVFVSADKGILSILNEVRAYSPVPLPRAFRIAGGKSGVDALFKDLSAV